MLFMVKGFRLLLKKLSGLGVLKFVCRKVLIVGCWLVFMFNKFVMSCCCCCLNSFSFGCCKLDGSILVVGVGSLNFIFLGMFCLRSIVSFFFSVFFLFLIWIIFDCSWSCFVCKWLSLFGSRILYFMLVFIWVIWLCSCFSLFFRMCICFCCSSMLKMYWLIWVLSGLSFIFNCVFDIVSCVVFVFSLALMCLLL